MPIRTHDPADLIQHERLLALMRYEPDVGEFFWLVKRNCYGGAVQPGMRVKGCVDRHGYKLIGLEGRYYQASRLAWFYVHGKWPNGEVDHRDRDTLNNRIENLRIAEVRALQRANQKVRRDSKSGLKGVSWSRRRQKWRARCKKREIGLFDTPEEAHAAYVAEAQRLFGQYARAE